jgi:hypothetical protein
MVRVIPPLFAVSVSAAMIAAWSLRSNRERSPTIRSLRSLRCSCVTSRCSAEMNSRISSDTSSAGRRQFSELNANSVR